MRRHRDGSRGAGSRDAATAGAARRPPARRRRGRPVTIAAEAAAAAADAGQRSGADVGDVAGHARRRPRRPSACAGCAARRRRAPRRARRTGARRRRPAGCRRGRGRTGGPRDWGRGRRPRRRRSARSRSRWRPFRLSRLLIGEQPILSCGTQAGARAPSRESPSGPLRPIAPHAETAPTYEPQSTTTSSASPARRARRAAARLRLLVPAAVPDRGAARRRTQFGGRPALVVAADDRMARDLALDLRAYLAPAPGALLPGPRRALRVPPGAAAAPRRPADRRARLAARGRPTGDPPVVVASAVALMERIPDPELRPHGFAIAVGEDARPRRDARAARGRAATSARSRSSSAASSRCAAASSTSIPRPRSAPCASSCSATRSSRCAGSRPSPSARSADARARRDRAGGGARTRVPRARRAGGRGGARASDPTSPRSCRSSASARSSSCCRTRRRVVVAAEEELRPALADHWQDVTTSLHSDDAHHLYLPPGRGQRGARAARRGDASRRSPQDQPHAVPRAGRRHRRAHDPGGRARAREARALRLPRRSSPGTGAARPSAPPTTSRACGPRFDDDGASAVGERACGSRRRALREGFIAPQLKLAVIPDHRLLRRRRAERPEGARGRALQAFTELRAGRHRRPHRPRHRPLHRLRHQDRRRGHARLPRARVPRRRPRLRPHRPARQAEPLRRRRRRTRRRSRSSAPRPGTT